MSAFHDTALRGRGAAGAAAQGVAVASRCAGMDSGSRRNDERQNGILVRTIGLVGAVLRRVRAGHEARVACRHLQSMSDWQLKDIGISRCDIERWAHPLPARQRRSRHAED